MSDAPSIQQIIVVLLAVAPVVVFALVRAFLFPPKSSAEDKEGQASIKVTEYKNMETGETFLALTGNLQANIGDHIHIQGVSKPVEFVASGILVREVK